MGLRKAAAYSKKKVTPYTRNSKKKNKAFIKAVPAQKIVKFEMGNSNLFHSGKLPHVLNVYSAEKVQIRHNALEACRQFINKKLDKDLAGQYFFKVVTYPHHVQRENKMLTGAGADRMQTGMQLSFGKAIGKAVIAQKGTKIFIIAVGTDKGLAIARKSIHQIDPKLPGKIKTEYERFSE
ncbi:MAG: 50S ribosomal protein L16 [Candidatus Pacearchaeota archaeon]|jgi:large subunit ribosomal protein L10e